MSALLAEDDRELALGIVEDVSALEAEAERPERRRADPQRHRGRRCAVATALGEALLPLALVEKNGLTALDGLAERSPLRRRDAAQPRQLLVRQPVRRDELDGGAVFGGERDHAGIRAQ